MSLSFPSWNGKYGPSYCLAALTSRSTMSRHHLTMPLAPLTKPASTQATYMDNAAPTPLNTSPRPTSRVEEQTAPSVDDGCYTRRDVKIVGILPVKEVLEPKDTD